MFVTHVNNPFTYKMYTRDDIREYVQSDRTSSKAHVHVLKICHSTRDTMFLKNIKLKQRNFSLILENVVKVIYVKDFKVIIQEKAVSEQSLLLEFQQAWRSSDP